MLTGQVYKASSHGFTQAQKIIAFPFVIIVCGVLAEPLIVIFILMNGQAIKLKWHFINAKKPWKVNSLENYSCCYSKHSSVCSSGPQSSFVQVYIRAI